jgi:DNA-binding NarL/FixJ family response regulator
MNPVSEFKHISAEWPMTNPIRLFLISDFKLLIEAVGSLLSERDDISFVGSTGNPSEFLSFAKTLDLDIVLIDVMSKGINPLHAIREARKVANLRVIALGMDYREENVVEYIEAGALGYVLRSASFSELVNIILSVYQGQSPCSSRIAASVFARYSELSRQQSMQRLVQKTALTLREVYVLQLMSVGLSNKEIAQHLNIALRTVKNHVHNIFGKLQVHYREDAINFRVLAKYK